MDPITLSLLIGGAGVGASILGSFLGSSSSKSANKTNQAINQQNIVAAKEMQNTNLQYQTQMYERALLDNSPSTMVQKYEQAGLNPYMMMQDGNWSAISQPSGSSGSVPSSIPMQSYHPDFSGVSDSVQRAVDAYYNNRYRQEEIKSLSVDNDFKATRELLDIQNRIEDLTHKKNLNKQDVEELKFLKDRTNYLKHTLNYRISQARSDANKSQAEAEAIDYDLFTKQIFEPFEKEMRASGMRLSWKQESLVQSQMYQVYEEIKNLRSQRKLTEAQEKQVLQAIRTGKPDEIFAIQKANWMSKELRSKLGRLRYVLRWESDDFSPTITNLSPFKVFGK